MKLLLSAAPKAVLVTCLNEASTVSKKEFYGLRGTFNEQRTLIELANSERKISSRRHGDLVQDLMKRVCLFLSVITVLPLQISFGHAETGRWPAEIRNTLFVFGSGLPSGSNYVDMEGFEAEASEPFPEEYGIYRYLIPTAFRLGKQDSHTLIAKWAVIQTSPVSLEQTKTISIAVPVKFIVESKMSVDQHRSFLQSRLLKMSLLTLDRDRMELGLLGSSHLFHVNDIYERCKKEDTKRSDDEPFKLAFDHVLVTEPQEIKKDTDFRIRIEWEKPVMPDEGKSEFALGDQIRIIDSNPDTSEK